MMGVMTHLRSRFDYLFATVVLNALSSTVNINLEQNYGRKL